MTGVCSPGCSRGEDSAESGGGGAGSSPRSEEGGVPAAARHHTSSASVKSESPASPLPHVLHTPAHQVSWNDIPFIVGVCDMIYLLGPTTTSSVSAFVRYN
jgi:hypothetical protein